MFKVIIKLLVFTAMVVFAMSFPLLINYFGQTKANPFIISAFKVINVNISGIKAKKIGYKFPLGASINEFSFESKTVISKNDETISIISGDQLFLRLVPSRELFHGILNFEIGATGLLITPKTSFGFAQDKGLKKEELINNFSQIIARKFNEEFICPISSLKSAIDFFSGLKECYKSSHFNNSIELAEVYFDILISGEKRRISINNITSKKLSINLNDILELNSLYKESLDEAQIAFIENYPLEAINMLLIKKYSEYATRDLENMNRYQGINVNAAYFHYLMTEYVGVESTNIMLDFYKVSTSKHKEEMMSSALLGKMSKIQNVEHSEFLTPEFFSRFNYDGERVENSNKTDSLMQVRH